MSKDTDEMEKMLNDYLQFGKEPSAKNYIYKYGRVLNELIKDFNNNNIRFNNVDTGIFITAEKTL